MNTYLVVLLVLIGFCLAFYYYWENKINYSNYKNALMTLIECEPELKEYLHNNPERASNILSVIEEIPFV